MITSTCCGIGGGVSNPILIPRDVPLPRSLILPPGFVPSQQITDVNDRVYLPAIPLPNEVIIPSGTSFLFDFKIPPGASLSDAYPPGEGDDDNNELMYITSTFWDGPHTVSCSYPCRFLLPPFTTRSTWTPTPFRTTIGTTSATVSPPVQETQPIRISAITVTSDSKPTFHRRDFEEFVFSGFFDAEVLTVNSSWFISH